MRRLGRHAALVLCLSLPAYCLADTPARRPPPVEVVALSLMTNWRASAGQFEEALVEARRWLAAAMRHGHPESEASAHKALASIFSVLGKADSAHVHALAVLEAASGPEGQELVPAALLALADALDAAGKVDSALVVGHSAAAAALANKDSLALGVALLHIGQGLLSNGQSVAALAHLDSALTVLVGSGAPRIEGAALAARGAALRRLGRAASACESFDKAFGALADSRTAHSDPARISLMDQSRDYFIEWQEAWLARVGEPGTHALMAALGVAERGRAQSLLDMVQPSHTLVEEDTGILRFLPNPRRMFGPGRNLVDDVRACIASTVPPGSALVYYSQLPESLAVWVYKDGVTRGWRRYLPARWPRRVSRFLPATLDTAMAEALAGWWSRQVNARGGTDSVLSVYSELCFPDTMLGVLRGVTEVVIVADAWLHHVPFNALRVGPRREYLGHLFPLRFETSLAMLADVEQRAPETEIVPEEVMVIGDPAGRLGRLKGARAEAESVAAMFQTLPITGSAATESLVIANWKRVRVLHIAAHGEAFREPSRALKSFVCLAPSSTADGDLTAGEIQNSLPRSQAELVFLSACKTAHGSLSESEGIVGLPRALLANGARSVVASMWHVDDASTAWLVRRFYEHLLHDRDVPSKAEALRRAMRETAQQPGWSDPKYWAAFKVYGAQ